MKVFISSRSFGAQCEEATDIIKQVADVERSTFKRPLNEADLVKVLPSYEGVIVGVDEITEKVIEVCDKLKVVAKHGVGVDNINLDACTRKGVIVTYVPGVNAESVADFAFCLMLALARKIVPAHISAKEGKWESKKFMGTELYRKTIGIIGLGAVGSRVAKRARGFDMKILYYDVRRNEELEKRLDAIDFVGLPTLLKESDIVSIHCALTSETEGMIGERELKLMKKSAFLINTSRGPILDEKAVYKALKEEWIAGAGFDVYTQEPPGAENPLLGLDNVVVVPHIASYTKESLVRVDLTQARDMVKALKGEKPDLVANPEVLEKLGIK